MRRMSIFEKFDSCFFFNLYVHLIQEKDWDYYIVCFTLHTGIYVHVIVDFISYQNKCSTFPQIRNQ